MAERREMRMGNLKALAPVLLLALPALGLAACGSSEQTTTKPPPAVSAPTARHLATLSEQVASDLEAGDTCDAAHAADELRAAVESADLSASLRPGVEAVATSLVDEVNCPPPPPPPEPEKKKKKDEKKPGQGHGDHHGGEKKPKEGKTGGLPPGLAKLKGEEG